MSDEKNNLIKNINFFSKLKTIKHINLIIVIFLCAVCALIYMSFLKKSSSEDETESETSYISSSADYVSLLEDKLTNSLKSIKNVGNVNVAITLDGEIEYVYAQDEEKKQNSVTSGSQTTTTTTSSYTTLFNNGKPIVIKEVVPEILGVVVTASGADDASVKLNIVKAVQTLLHISSSKIEVLTGNK